MVSIKEATINDKDFFMMIGKDIFQLKDGGTGTSSTDEAFNESLFNSLLSHEELIHIAITNSETIWRYALSKRKIEEISNECKKDYDSTAHLLFLALAYHTDRSSHFKFEMDDNDMLFVKQVIGGGVKANTIFLTRILDNQFHFCSLQLEKIGGSEFFTNMFSMLQVVVNQLNNCQTKLKAVKEENKILDEQRNKSVKKLEELVDATEERETDLYSKFVAVLNEKKRKIHQLKEGGSSDRSHQMEESSDNEENENTDDELKTEDKSASTLKRLLPSSDLCDVLLPSLNSEDPQPISSKRGRPKRSRVKQTASSNLPRTTSLPRPSRQAEESTETTQRPSTSTRRSSSRNSNTPSLDLDALMEQL